MIEKDYRPHRGIDGLGAMLTDFQESDELRTDLGTRVIASIVVGDAISAPAVAVGCRATRTTAGASRESPKALRKCRESCRAFVGRRVCG
jgi:hypothetical protein